MARVLVIEDDPSLALLLRDLLYDEGYDPVEAASLSDAANAVAERPVDLIVADLVEFDLLGGAGALEALKKLACGRPIVLCSGQPDAQLLAQEAGITSVLGKPFDCDELLGGIGAELVRAADTSRR